MLSKSNTITLYIRLFATRVGKILCHKKSVIVLRGEVRIKKIGIPEKFTPDTMKMISTKIESPQNLEETRKMFKDELETLAILKHISQKDLEVKDLINRGYNAEGIRKFVTLRELKKYL